MDNKILRLKAQLGLLTLPFIISGQTHVEAWGRCFVSKWLTQFLDNEKETQFSLIHPRLIFLTNI